MPETQRQRDEQASRRAVRPLDGAAGAFPVAIPKQPLGQLPVGCLGSATSMSMERGTLYPASFDRQWARISATNSGDASTPSWTSIKAGESPRVAAKFSSSSAMAARYQVSQCVSDSASSRGAILKSVPSV